MTKMFRRMVISLLALSLCCAERSWAQQAADVEARMRRDITFLASDECEGRGPGTKGIDKAADYIATDFAKSGLKPAMKGSYFQPFTISGRAKLEDSNSLTIINPDNKAHEFKIGEDAKVLGLSGTGKVTAPLVFAGYGATAKNIDYDDYKGLDVAGKIVVLIRRVPRWKDKNRPFDGANKESHASVEMKMMLAEQHQAAAVLLVNDQSEEKDTLFNFADLTSASASKIPVMHVKRTVVDEMVQATLGKTLAEIEKKIDADLKPMGAPLKGWSASIQCSVNRNRIAVKNIIGVLPGSGPLADETVVIGAHYDHLGYGDAGSLAKLKKGEKAIHHGADDNASGTTSVMELARRFGAMPKKESMRRLVFIAFSGEERGLLGSRHYCNKDPIFPLDKTVAMVNLDMVGRLRDDADTKKGKLIAEGLGTGKGFEELVEKLANDEFKLIKKQSGVGPSDHDSFCRKNIPVIFLWNGTHPDYHRPSDTSDKINVSGMRHIVDLSEKIIVHLATDPKRPEYVQVKGQSNNLPRPKGPRLGVVPDYDDTVKGLAIEDVAAGGPAEKAGMKAGDVIVEIGGQAVTNIGSYMLLMGKQKAGEPVEVGIQRGGKRIMLKVTPQ